MIFSTEVAEKLVKNYNISNSTLRVWKHRGKIPEKYTKEKFKMRIPVPANDADILHLNQVMTLPEINMKAFTSVNIPYHKLIGVFTCKNDTLSIDQVKELRGQILQLKESIDMMLYTIDEIELIRNLKQLLSLSFFKKHTILNNAGIIKLHHWTGKADYSHLVTGSDAPVKIADQFKMLIKKL